MKIVLEAKCSCGMALTVSMDETLSPAVKDDIRRTVLTAVANHVSGRDGHRVEVAEKSEA